ncbi:MAG TPA: ADP-forming succinate--CoA ligase subunit beta [Gaiellaceae bacterium]
MVFRLLHGMDLYEYQGKELFRQYGLPTGEGRLAQTPAEARAAAEELGGSVVVKAQVHVGGRGKAGGVKVAKSPEEAEVHAAAILGLEIKGHTVRRLWIESASEIAREYYLSLTLDRGAKKPLFMFTTEGGVEIEQVAATNPEALVKLHVDPLEGFHPWHGRALTFGAAIADANERHQIERLCGQLYEVFTGCDATLCEINPLVVTKSGDLLALDAKVSVDDNALFRHEEIAAMRDPEAVPVEERAAREKGVTYVKLDGEIGVLGNGAGLVMSTLDLVALAGGRPANFCDLGGGGGAQGVVDALEVISADPQVRTIFFNIFGGITRCDEVARGILQALETISIAQPIVVRFDGTNAEEGRRLLAEAKTANLYPEPTMLEAAKRAVELAG